MPAFDYQGPLCGLAAFNAPCAFRFWKGELVAPGTAKDVMARFGRIESLPIVVHVDLIAALKKNQ